MCCVINLPSQITINIVIDCCLDMLTNHRFCKITATLKINNSDVVPGSDAGQYIENVEYAGGGNLDKTTKGFIYNEADKNKVAENKLPYNIYFDHIVHFGLILAAIIKEMLFASGVIDNMDNPDL